jgi:hypothetical protein
VIESFDGAEQERFAEPVGQLADRPLELHRADRILVAHGRRALDRDLHRSARRATEVIANGVRRDPVEPGAEGAARHPGVLRSMDREEGLLEQIARELGTADTADEVAVDPLVMAVEQHAIRSPSPSCTRTISSSSEGESTSTLPYVDGDGGVTSGIFRLPSANAASGNADAEPGEEPPPRRKPVSTKAAGARGLPPRR